MYVVEARQNNFFFDNLELFHHAKHFFFAPSSSSQKELVRVLATDSMPTKQKTNKKALKNIVHVKMPMLFEVKQNFLSMLLLVFYNQQLHFYESRMGSAW